MRLFAYPLIALTLAVAPTTAGAESLLGGSQRAPTSDRAVRPALPEDTRKILDEEFAKLAEATSAREAHGPERRILARLARSGSDTVDLYMTWASEAMTEKDFPLALDLLDQVISMKPGFAEAYNRRATVYYATEDYRRSLDDIRTTLSIEPRHFGALSGLAAILREIGDIDRATEVYRRLLAVHPMMDSAKTGLEQLETGAGGNPI